MNVVAPLLYLLALTQIQYAAPRIYTDANLAFFAPEFAAPLAVPPDERISISPEPDEYVAFSLGNAMAYLSTADPEGWRDSRPDIFTLGGINVPTGVVYDEHRNDLIIVGRHESGHQPLTLDDLVLALRARLVDYQWPLVSIDPNGPTQLQKVIFEGGIQDTQFGYDLLDADYHMKLINLGLLNPGVEGFPDSWQRQVQSAMSGTFRRLSVVGRFWYYPVTAEVVVRDGVSAIGNVEVSVFHQVESVEVDGVTPKGATLWPDEDADAFAADMARFLNQLAAIHPSIGRLRGLEQLVALAEAMRSMNLPPSAYSGIVKMPVRQVPTPRFVRLVGRRQDFSDSGSSGSLSVSGGVLLSALALRLQSGDVTALRQAVLSSRPSGVVSWTFIANRWFIPTHPSKIDATAGPALFAYAKYMTMNRRTDAALSAWTKLIGIFPKLPELYLYRARVHFDRHDYVSTLGDLANAQRLGIAEDDPIVAAGVSLLRGQAEVGRGEFDAGIVELSAVIQSGVNLPGLLVQALIARGIALGNVGRSSEAENDYERAIALGGANSAVYYNISLLLWRKGDYAGVRQYLNRAIEVNPLNADAAYNRGVLSAIEGQGAQALEDFDHAISADPTNREYQVAKARFLMQLGRYSEAVAVLDRAVGLFAGDPEVLLERGWQYLRLGIPSKAAGDFQEASRVGGRSEEAMVGQVGASLELHEIDRARRYCDFLLESQPTSATGSCLSALITLYFRGGETARAKVNACRREGLLSEGPLERLISVLGFDWE